MLQLKLDNKKQWLPNWLHESIDSMMGRDNKDKNSPTYVKGTDKNAVWNAYNFRERKAITHRYYKQIKFLKEISVVGTRPQRVKLILEFNDKLSRCYNDHRSVVINEHTDPFNFMQPINVADHDNLVVLSGLTKMAEILANQSNTFFNFIEVGEDATPVDLLNTHLKVPHYRMNILELGWFEPHGNHLMSGTIFPEDMPNTTIREMGAFDEAVGGAMWWRIAITDIPKQLEHEVGETYVTISHSHHLKGK